MNEPALPIEIALRIPGKWSDPGELVEKLPEGFRLTPESLVLPDGTSVEFGAVAADDRFAEVFRMSLRHPATDEEQATVDEYSVNVMLAGPGGSLDSAHAMMRAAAAIIKAGGAGVFIDNSALSHGGQDWVEMTEIGGPDALSFAFVSIVRGKVDVETMGMHVLGLRDLSMKRADIDDEGTAIIEVIRYLAAGDRPIDDGHILADLNGPRFQAFTQPGDPKLAGSPMHNPFGRLRLVSMRDIADAN